MKNTLRILAILVLILITVSFVNAYTGTAKLSWTPPTTFTDGSVLIPATDLKGSIYIQVHNQEYMEHRF